MTIGVTGAKGFIGTYLVREMNRLGLDTKIFDGNLSDIGSVDSFLEGCDMIIHLAGNLSNNFGDLLEANVMGTHNLVESSKRHHLKKIIFTSSGAVYGEPINGNISYESDVPSPNTLYGLSKLYAEEYLNFSGISYTILRFPNVYGPGNKKGVIYNFIKSINESGRVNILGSGDQKRNFLYVEDAVDALIKSIDLIETKEIFNIADDSLYSILDVVSEMRKQGLNFEVEYHEADKTNQLKVLSEDIQKAYSILKWKPQVSLPQGLEMTIDSLIS